jgi:hypothetical protein
MVQVALALLLPFAAILIVRASGLRWA